MAVGELIPGFAAWLRSCIPGGFVVLISEDRDWGVTQQISQGVVEENPALPFWGVEPRAAEDLVGNVVHSPAFRKVHVRDLKLSVHRNNFFPGKGHTRNPLSN